MRRTLSQESEGNMTISSCSFCHTFEICKSKESKEKIYFCRKEAELEDTRTQLRDQSEANREWLASKDLMSRELDAKDAEIDQLRKTGKTSDTVIQWLVS